MSSHYNHVRHLRCFHSHELEGKDKLVMIYTKRKRQKKGYSTKKAVEEKKNPKFQKNPLDESQDQEKSETEEEEEEESEDPKVKNKCRYCAKRGEDLKFLSRFFK